MLPVFKLPSHSVTLLDVNGLLLLKGRQMALAHARPSFKPVNKLASKLILMQQGRKKIQGAAMIVCLEQARSKGQKRPDLGRRYFPHQSEGHSRKRLSSPFADLASWRSLLCFLELRANGATWPRHIESRKIQRLTEQKQNILFLLKKKWI